MLLLYVSEIMGQTTLPVLKYSTGKWNPDSLGNHRAVAIFNGEGNAARSLIQWRRRDYNPEKKRIIVVDAQTGRKINNVKVLSVTRETGDLLFEPASGKGAYYIYYMPYKDEGKSNYPKGIYLAPEETASAEWLKSIEEKKLPDAECREIQSVNEFNSFYPMEVIATREETERLLSENKGTAFLVFPEQREYPVKMDSDLPLRWIQNGPQKLFKAEAAKGENFTWQIALYAVKTLNDVKINFTDLVSPAGKTISGKSITCFNAGGINYEGKPFEKKISVEAGKIQSLWCGTDIPADIAGGEYSGKVIINAGGEEKIIQITLKIGDKIVSVGGINEPWKQTRLEWLNSTLAQKNDVIPPYTPLKVERNSISLLGRKIALEASGLPGSIQTYMSEEMTSYTKKSKNVLAKPFELVAEKKDAPVKWNKGKFKITSALPGTVKWESSRDSKELVMNIHGSLEFDGFASFEIKITASEDVDLKDIRLEIPFSKEAAKYMMGLGQKGGARPQNFNWKWDVANKNQDGAWIGDVNAGLQFSLKDENYVRPLNTNFYLQKPLNLPSSWGNNGNGGISIEENKGTLQVNNFSGARKMKKGETLYFNFTLLITPFHTIDTDFQWSTRFYHSYAAIDTVKAAGATIINIHHGTEINPYLNYPFIEHKKMKDYIDEAHSKGLKVKIYNTVRELSNSAYELFPLKSLGHEIFSAGNGGGFPWLQEHVGNDYIAAWFVPAIKDAAIINSGMSRWHNYYVEGMNWLVKNVGIDGIYLDDVAFDRITMKRVKRILTQEGHPGIIDLHSANQYNKRDGFINSALLYMEHFPYLNRLWFGEYFDYENNSNDFYLTEVSGIPFGLMGEMLQDGGNPWRGMVYGMTNRMPWTANSDPRPLWKIWDEFGIAGSKMIGYWAGSCPVKTNDKNIVATVYKKKGSALVSIASWNDETANVKLMVDWKSLGINPAKAVIKAPAIKDFQPEKEFNINGEITVEKGKGWLIIIKER
jgi:hypothetical protein